MARKTHDTYRHVPKLGRVVLAAADELRIIRAPGQVADAVLMIFKSEALSVVGCVIDVDPLVLARSGKHGPIVGELEKPDFIVMMTKFKHCPKRKLFAVALMVEVKRR